MSSGEEGEGQAVKVRAMRREDMPDIHRMIIVIGVGILNCMSRVGNLAYFIRKHTFFVQDLAIFEQEPNGPKLSVQDLIADGFESSPPWFFGLVAEVDGKLVGHALCSRAYSSWLRKAFYIEDLYVDPTYRSAGIGRKLLQELCKMAVEADAYRIDWHVLENNSAALSFYAKLGARDLRITEKRAALRLDRHRIEAVAKGQFLDVTSKESTQEKKEK